MPSDIFLCGCIFRAAHGLKPLPSPDVHWLPTCWDAKNCRNCEETYVRQGHKNVWDLAFLASYFVAVWTLGTPIQTLLWQLTIWLESQGVWMLIQRNGSQTVEQKSHPPLSERVSGEGPVIGWQMQRIENVLLQWELRAFWAMVWCPMSTIYPCFPTLGIL